MGHQRLVCITPSRHVGFPRSGEHLVLVHQLYHERQEIVCDWLCSGDEHAKRKMMGYKK